MSRLKCNNISVGNFADDFKAIVVIRITCIHPAENFLCPEISWRFWQIYNKVFWIKIISNTAICGVVGNKNIRKWRRGVCNICAALEAPQ